MMSAVLLVAILLSVASLGFGIPSSSILAIWVSMANGSITVVGKLLSTLLCLACYLSQRAPPAAFLAWLNPEAAADADASADPRDGYFSAASSLGNSPQKPVRSARARAASDHEPDAASQAASAAGEGDSEGEGGGGGDGDGEGEGFLSAPTSPKKFSRAAFAKACTRKVPAAGVPAGGGAAASPRARALHAHTGSPRTSSASPDDAGSDDAGSEVVRRYC